MNQLLETAWQQPQHYVAIHNKNFRKQPQNNDMGFITNDFKRIGHAERKSIFEIFKAASRGQCIIPANYEMDFNSPIKLGSFRFISSSLILVDIDDDTEKTNPTEVLAQLKDKCTGLFYTFSHGIKGNRYRLVFQLDRPLTDKDLYKRVVLLLLDDLSKLGLPVDRNVKDPTQVARTGIKGFVINDLNVTLDVTEYTERAKREQLIKAEKAKEVFESEMKYKITFSELKEMAEKVGYIPSGSGQAALWNSITVGIKHYAESGGITDEEGWELYNIISGGEQSRKAWEGLRASGRATIATLIYHARERGYQRKPYRYALEKKPVTYTTERQKVKEHIPVELAVELIERKQRILVDSPTGSGKSTAFIGASKQLAKSENNRFFIFAVPTRTLAEQLARKHGVLAVTGDKENIYKSIFAYQKVGNRVFVATYDMAANLINTLKDWHKVGSSFCLIVDEIHKYVTDYNRSYRYEAITNLHQASKEATSFIGLSGTTQDILKSEFDIIIQIDNGKPSSPCQEFAVYTYEKQKDALPSLVKLIEAWTTQRKMLIYVQSKEQIATLYDLLRKRGIVTRTISAAEKKNSTYKALIEHETVPDNVQVILATSVIADGISIKNSLEWECLVVANHFSDMFNISMLKQCSNRFRNTYRRFSIYMQNPSNTETDLFNIDSAYEYIFSSAKRFQTALNAEFATKDLALFRASIIEKEYGLYAAGDAIEIDTFYLRYAASTAQEKFYRTRRLAFIKALEKVLHKKNTGTLDINAAIENKKLNLALIESEISDLQAEFELDREARKNNIKTVFTEQVFRAFHEQEDEVLREFKSLVLPEHYSCIERLYRITDFATCKKIVMQWKRRSDTYDFYTRIQRLVDIWHFSALARSTETKKIYKAVAELAKEGFMDKEDLEKRLLKIARKKRVQLKKLQKVLNGFFFKETTRNGNQRLAQFIPVGFEKISSVFEIDPTKLVKIVQNYAQDQSKIVQVIVGNELETLKNQYMQENMQFV